MLMHLHQQEIVRGVSSFPLPPQITEGEVLYVLAGRFKIFGDKVRLDNETHIFLVPCVFSFRYEKTALFIAVKLPH